MAEIEVEVTVGGMLPLTVPSTTSTLAVISGGGKLGGWSFRDTTVDTPTEAEGNVVAPAAGATIVTLTGLPAGNYTVKWTVGLQGAAAAADANNFQLLNNAAVVEGSINAGAAGEYIQPDIVLTVAQNGSVTVKAIAAGTAGVTYSASLSLIPTGDIETIVEITSGLDVLGEVDLTSNSSTTEHFGDDGPIFNNGVQVNVISGAARGVVYVIPRFP